MLTEIAANLVSNTPREIDVSNDALMQLLDAFHNVGRRATLRAMLHNAIVFASRLNHLASLENIVRAWLFDVHILSSLTAPNDP